VALVGPTGAGKTDLAVELAQLLGAEIASVDSRQVYRRLDIGTAKAGPVAREIVPHHLLDLVEPDEHFDAALFAEAGARAIAEAHSRGRNPLLCGGSGLYLRALVDGLCAAPPADGDVRAVLDKERNEQGLAALYAELARVDPGAAARIAPRDAVRILRALEVFRLTGRALSEWQRESRAEPRYDVLVFVLSPEPAALDRRIADRALRMWEGGLIEETRQVLAAGFCGDLPPLQAIGYREAQLYLEGVLDREAAVEAMVLATRRYAKRQRTWFRGLHGAIWLEGREPIGALRSLAERFLAGEDPRSKR
jgi:tRNA dimethylallyltransferase